jgi:branched-chain amino acid transport system substrate-binding protein
MVRNLALYAALLMMFGAGWGTSPAAAVEAGSRFVPQERIAGEAAFDRGMELYAAGRKEEALSHLRGVVIRHPDSPLVPRANLLLARIFLESGQFEESLLYLGRIPAEKRGAEERLLEGVALIALGQHGRAVQLLQTLEGAEFSIGDQRLRYAALAEGNIRLENYLRALFFLHRNLSLPDSQDTHALLHQAHLLLRGHLSDPELAEAAFMFSGTAIGQDALLQQAHRAHARGDTEEARRLAASIVRNPVPFPYRRNAVELLRQLTGEVWVQRAVGVVLPLSGRFATFGNLVRRGMELALENTAQQSVRFVFRDTGADPVLTAQAVSELVHEEGVLGIIGPLTGAAAALAAEQAQREQVPLLSLSQRDGIPETGDFIFRNSLTAKLQVQTLVRYAMEEQGLRSFAILYPENRLGQEMTELFTREVERYGGHIVDRRSYFETATDFRRQIMHLQGKNPEASARERQEDATDYVLPFEALFIPDYADRAGLIIPQLPYYGVENVVLLGINGWNSPELVRMAGRHAEGAVFVDGFFRHSPYPFVKDFAHRYFEKYGEEPSILEAQGYDAATILLSVLENAAAATREDIREALLGVYNFPGVTGATSFGANGEAEKILYLLQIQKGDIVQIN